MIFSSDFSVAHIFACNFEYSSMETHFGHLKILSHLWGKFSASLPCSLWDIALFHASWVIYYLSLVPDLVKSRKYLSTTVRILLQWRSGFSFDLFSKFPLSPLFFHHHGCCCHHHTFSYHLIGLFFHSAVVSWQKGNSDRNFAKISALSVLTLATKKS